jgi:hypothetical protein
MSRAADFGLALAKQRRRHTGTPGRSVDEELLHLVVFHDDESHGLAVGLSHPHALDPFPRARHEVLLFAIGEEPGRDVPEVTVVPACMPYPGDRTDIVGGRLADREWSGSRGVVCVHRPYVNQMLND